MKKDFGEELNNIWNKVIRKQPFAFARYGDGELLLIKGKKVGTDTQAFKQDSWFASDGISLLGRDLYNTLHHIEANYYYGIPCDLSNVQAKEEYLSIILQKFEYITFANLFINANYPLFKRMLATLEEEVVVIANKAGIERDISPLKIKEFIPVENNCVSFWEKESKKFLKQLEQLAGYSETLFLISAGPLAKVIIDRLWNKNQTNRYVDVGSALDEIIHKRITRPYQMAGHEYANHIGVLMLDDKTIIKKQLTHSLNMRLRDGVPTIKEYEEVIHSDYFLIMEAYSNQFLTDVAGILESYNQKWVQDPLHQWSRQWEYAFTLLGIQASIADYSSNDQIHILDAGSGVTFFPYYLANTFPNASVTCIDYDPSYASLFTSINKRVSHQVAFLNQDMHTIKAPDNSFDVIYCISVLEHTEEYETIIQEFKRLLKKGGILIVSFDISLDGKEGISVESAEKLLQKLLRNFSEAEHSSYKTIVENLRDYDIVTTNRINSLNPNLLPWKGQYFANLSFSCHLFRKLDERISKRIEESTTGRQEGQQIDKKTKINDVFISSSCNKGEITVILNGYQRHNNLSRIYDAVHNQTVPPKEIMLWYNDFHSNHGNSELAEKCISALTNHNFGVWARFAYALNATTEYVCIFDDDTIPGKRWFENCLETMKTHEGLLGTIGVIFNSFNYWDYKRYGWANPNKDVIRVDLVGHCWFFKREWLTAFWRELRPEGFDFVGEDMHFSYALQKYLSLGTYVPPHPPEDRSLWGSLEGNELGIDSVAISITNKDNAYKKFDDYLKLLLNKGWKLICLESKRNGIEAQIQSCVSSVQPLVSVIIPCYNQAQFLLEAVASVVTQTYSNCEIVIVNDGSPDNTTEIAKQIIKTYPHQKIRLIEKENGGCASARNAGIAAAKGDYILPLDADDLLNTNAISYLVEIAVRHPLPCVAFGSHEIFGIDQAKIICADLYSAEKIKFGNMLTCTALYPKNVWSLVKGYKEEINDEGYEDWEFWLNCHKHNISFYGTREVILYYRRQPASRTLKGRDKRDYFYTQVLSYHPELFKPTFIIDGVFFQLFDEGIARRWKSLLEEWVANGFATYVILLDRDRTAPKIPGIRSRLIPAYNYNSGEADSQMLQQICEQEQADLFVSTYYTKPLLTPSIFISHDMISENTSSGLIAKSVSSMLIDATLQPLKLRDINLIVFPDWSEPEESLGWKLEQVIKPLLIHPNKSHITLLIPTSNITEEDANLMLSSVMMDLLMQEDLDVEAGPEISLFAPLGAMQWDALLPRINARIVLEHENQQAIAQSKAEKILTYEIPSFGELTSVLT